VYYNTGANVSNATGYYVGSKEASGTSSTSVTIEKLLENTSYSFMIEKMYIEYGDINSSTLRQSTIQKIEPTWISANLHGYTLKWDTNVGSSSTQYYQIVEHKRKNVARSWSHGSRNASWNDYIINMETDNIIQEKRIILNNIDITQTSKENIKVSENDLDFVSVRLKTDSYHNDISSGIFWYYKYLINTELKFGPIWFALDDTSDVFIRQTGMPRDWFLVKLHDDTHNNNASPYHDPINSKTRIVTVNAGNLGDGDYYTYEPSLQYYRHGYSSKFGPLTDIGIYNLYEGALDLYFALVNNNLTDTKFGSLYNTFYKVSSTTLRLFITKMYHYGQQALKYNNDKFVQYVTHNGTNLVHHRASQTDFIKIMVYKDRITTVQYNKLPLVIQWLDTENGDIAWNGHVDNRTPPIKPDIPIAIEIRDTFVTLSWIPNPNNHGVLTHYEVNKTDINGTIQETQSTSNKNNKHTFTGLTSGTTHYFTVTKVISNPGDFSYLGHPSLDLCSYPSPYWRHTDMKGSQQNYYDTYDATSTHASVAAVPMVNGILEVTTLFSGIYAEPPNTLTGTPSTISVSLSWDAGNHNDATFLSYTVNREDAGGTIVASVPGIAETPYIWTNLDAGQQYHFTVQKVTERGTTAKSNQLSIYTLDVYGTNPGTPEMHSRDLKSVTFRWSPGDLGSGTLVSHNLVRYNDIGGTIVGSKSPSTGIFHGDETIVWSQELEPDTDYYFRSEMIVNYNGNYITTQSANVFTFSYIREYPTVPEMYTRGPYFQKTSTTTSVTIGWYQESHGDYTLEKVVINRMAQFYTDVAPYSSQPSWETLLWTEYINHYYHSPSNLRWEDIYIDQIIEIYPDELTNYYTGNSYRNGTYEYNFVIDGATPDSRYHFVVQKVYSDLSESQYSNVHSGGQSLPVISKAFPYYTSVTLQFKGIDIYTSVDASSNITVSITLNGIDASEVIDSITFTKHPLNNVDQHGSSPWTEKIVYSTPTYQATFSAPSYTLIPGTMYNLGAIVAIGVNTYFKYRTMGI
jgi:hypothetical protein